MRLSVLVVAAVLAVSALALAFIGPGSSGDPGEEAPVAQEVAAEAAPAESPPAPPPSTTTTTPPATTLPPTDNPILAEAYAVLVDATERRILALVEAMADTGDPTWVPYLIDLVRLLGTPDTVIATQDALAELTGEPPPENLTQVYPYFGAWLQGNAVDAGEDYVAWKSTLYGLIDPAFNDLLGQVDDPVLAARLQWGGVRRGGIPELNGPARLTVADAAYMQDDELTFGAVINGEARSYPHRILDHHELANDELGGEPVALANCTLCRTGVLYSRKVGDMVLDFETSGFLLNSNKVMVDVQTNTLWNQLTGEALAGPLLGTVLDRFPITVTLYGDWVSEHPETDVVAIPDANYPYSYDPGDAYADYYASPDVFYPALEVPDAFADKAEVVTVDLDGHQLAVGVEALQEAGPTIFTLGERTLLAVPTSGGARFYAAVELADSEEGLDLAELLAAGQVSEDVIEVEGYTWPRVQSGQSFWFAWFANFPETEWWPA